jgi:hypothetical protein
MESVELICGMTEIQEFTPSSNTAAGPRQEAPLQGT